MSSSSSLAPFTAAQWKELEHQAMIYKYLVAGVSVPPDLLVPIQRSSQLLAASFFQHPSLAYSSCYGKKIDPEPGRCRRTDGKKWRCSKDACPDSKYCERHMHRSRNRSRKPVESQSTSQSSPLVVSQATGISGGSVSFQNPPLHLLANPEDSSSGSNVNVPKSQMEFDPRGFTEKEYWNFNGPNSEAAIHDLSPQSSGGARTDSNISNTSWYQKPCQIPVNSYRPSCNAYSEIDFSRPPPPPPVDDAATSKQQQNFPFASDFSSPEEHNHLLWPFLDERPNNVQDSWSNLYDKRSL